ncbi:MAG: ATP-binding protein [Sedimentibacter saalensis]|uniref:ATP-binding protein n=1 Tax=Sedimentibacter saalensis TaxID=130788 RepID=UPI002B1F499E|nr:ATP-binding protein [Sedimentibacter saalensis]MEA5096774.1 ATP-binding protein [Sedimentibacter saalensis]
MPEKQNIEYKSSWHDKYLEWVCGFANAQGGEIYIGKEDSGKVTGVEDYKKLMEDIPNKIRNYMGISADVNLLQEDDKYYIEIVVQPYSVPISLHGQYFYRSGSVKMELTGNSLNEFLLKRSGLTWDEVTEPRATFDDIDERSFRMYLEMSKEKDRLPDVEGLTMEEIFEKLRLTKNGELTRAAIILFGKDPRRFSTNAFVKIGRFKGDADLRFQDVEEGNLIVLLKNVLERLDHKYLTRSIEFKGMLRLEHSEYPIPALREMLLNALVHRKYMGSFIQIRVYDDKITIWNDGRLPEEITLESLKHVHSSHPRNPLIADVCFKGGLIDSWGRGTVRIIETCKEAGLHEPELIERDGGFLVTLFKDNLTEEQLVKLGLNARQVKAVSYVKEKGRITNSDYQALNEISDRTSSRDLEDLVAKGVLKRVGDKKSAYYEI